ncbi:MAG: T9SS type A sorting domain-containing protein [Bacteroidetes bacterium]|nr:T9SS type A sorting domain-containing protein [Bacteroidota bacterium]
MQSLLVSLVDITGKTLWINKDFRSQGLNYEILPMEDFSVGMYFLKIQTKKGASTQKIEKTW